METKPIVLICSNTKTKPETLMALIFNSKSIDKGSPSMIKSNWNVETKYYSAEVSLVGIEEDFERSEDFNNRVEALIIHVDPDEKNWVDNLDSWNKIILSCHPEVQLLVTDNENESCSDLAFEWYHKRKANFETVSLFENLEPPEEASDFQEKTGVDRIVEVLHSHKWSNMKKKSLRGKSYEIGNGSKMNRKRIYPIKLKLRNISRKFF